MTRIPFETVSKRLAILFALLLFPSLARAEGKTVLLYSSDRPDSLRAAEGIREQLRGGTPSVEVVLKDVRDFMRPHGYNSAVDRVVGAFLANHAPGLNSTFFQSWVRQGKQVKNLDDLPEHYNLRNLARYLEAERAQSIVATHVDAALALGDLREQGKLRLAKLGWVNTDSYTGFSPRISKRLDKTWLTHPEMEKDWLAAGVEGSRVAVVPFPIAPGLKPADGPSLLGALGADPAKATYTISGRHVAGVGLALESLAKNVATPFQVVVDAGNPRAARVLLARRAALEKTYPQMQLVIRPSLSDPELATLAQLSHTVITDGSRISAPELEALGTKRVVLVDVFGGESGANARALGARGGVAVISSWSAPLPVELGLRKPGTESSVSLLPSVHEFVTHGKPPIGPIPAGFGQANGPGVRGARGALQKLDRDAPGEVEIFLSYANDHSASITRMTNPFGHLSMRVEDKVLTANPMAVKGEDPELMASTSLEEFLYATKPPTPNAYETSSYAQAYGRNIVGLRVRGLTPERVLAMRKEWEKIESEWQADGHDYNYLKYNCAHMVARILKAGGIDTKFNEGGYATPLGVFESARAVVKRDGKLGSDMVLYTFVPDSKNQYREHRFPLSIHHITRSLGNLLFGGMEKLEKQVNKRVAVYPGDPVVYYENIDGKTAGAPDLTPAASGGFLPSLWGACADGMRRFRDRLADASVPR